VHPKVLTTATLNATDDYRVHVRWSERRRCDQQDELFWNIKGADHGTPLKFEMEEKLECEKQKALITELKANKTLANEAGLRYEEQRISKEVSTQLTLTFFQIATLLAGKIITLDRKLEYSPGNTYTFCIKKKTDCASSHESCAEITLP